MHLQYLVFGVISISVAVTDGVRSLIGLYSKSQSKQAIPQLGFSFNAFGVVSTVTVQGSN